MSDPPLDAMSSSALRSALAGRSDRERHALLGALSWLSSQGWEVTIRYRPETMDVRTRASDPDATPVVVRVVPEIEITGETLEPLIMIGMLLYGRGDPRDEPEAVALTPSGEEAILRSRIQDLERAAAKAREAAEDQGEAYGQLYTDLERERERSANLRAALAGLVSPDRPEDMDSREPIVAMLEVLRGADGTRSAMQMIAAAGALLATLPEA